MSFIPCLCTVFLLAVTFTAAQAAEPHQTDVIETRVGPLKLTFLGHSTLMFDAGGVIIHIDPWNQVADYSALPAADIILVTHGHGDHFDSGAIKSIRTEKTIVIAPPSLEDRISAARILANGDSTTIGGIAITAVPAYNIVHKRPTGEPYHPKGEGNGYVVLYGGVRVYLAGDTENIPEMAGLRGIDVAFLPMNLPYTMTPEMAAEAARVIHPRILYPYHYGETDPGRLQELLAGGGIDVRIRDLR